MKLKKILTILVFSVLAFTGAVFGCKDKYANFSIQVNGQNEITLRAGDYATDEYPNSREIEILIKNAPNNNCRNISYSVSQNNIVSIEEISSTSKDIKRYKITALDNISAFEPSTVITFKTSEGNKSCDLKVNVQIPLQSISANLAYNSFVVSDNKPYYIDASKALTYFPKNTTDRDVEFSLVDGLIDGVTLTLNGEIKVDEEKYFGQENISGKIKVRATSKTKSESYADFYVSVLRDIKLSDLTLGYDLNDVKYSFSGDLSEEEENYENSISFLTKNGITLSSNVNKLKNANFRVKINESFGLNFEQIETKFESLILSNILVESNYSKDDNNTKNYIIYTKNPGKDVLNITIKYKSVENYSKEIQIPITVLEYPTSLVVNNNAGERYDIFDYYKNNARGQEFAVSISQIGAYNDKFKVLISEEDFNFVEIRYQDELLGYNELTSRAFANNSSLFVIAKEIQNETKEIKLTFYSDILKNKNLEEITDDFNKKLIKEISLNLVPGVRSLSFETQINQKETFYLEKSNEEFNVPFVVNNSTNGIKALNEFINLEIVSGEDLVEISKDVDQGKFVLKSKNKTGLVEFYLKSQNGIETSHKKLLIYSGLDDSQTNPFEFVLSSNNIKTVIDENNETKYYIGSTYGKNSANFNVLNKYDATIYNAEIKSSNNAVKATVLDAENLLFNLYASENIEEKVTITVTIWVYNDFDKVNEDGNLCKKIEIDFDIYTYEPLQSVKFNNGQLFDRITLTDGEGLDVDSLNNKLNMLDLNKLINIQGTTTNVTKKVIFPSELIEGADYDVENKVELFDAIYFHVYKNHQNKFIDGKFVFGLTIEVYDLVGSNESYRLTLTVELKEQTKPEKVVIKNNGGFVYLDNLGNGLSQIEAEVVGENRKEATNKNLYFKIVDGNSVVLDNNTGVVTVQSAGITKIRVYAKASKYSSSGDYSIFSDVYVVSADGSKSFPYILQNNRFIENSYYTLNENVVLNSSLSLNIKGIDGKFRYAKYSNLYEENAIYSLIFNGTGSVFEKEEFVGELENLNVIYNKNSITINSKNFGLIASKNSGTIKNVNLIVNGLTIHNNAENNNIGLYFAENVGNIENCTISSAESDYASILIDGKGANFGGFVAINKKDGDKCGSITSGFDFLKINNHSVARLRIIDLTSAQDHCVAGLVSENSGNISGIQIEAKIESNAKFVGGIVGKIVSENIRYKNLHFNGSLISKNVNSVVGGISAYVSSNFSEDGTDFSLIFVEFTESIAANSTHVSGHTVGGLFGSADFGGQNRTNVKYAYAQNFAKVGQNSSNLKGEVVGGLVGTNASLLNITAVYSDVKILCEKDAKGAFIGAMKANTEIDNAYSYVTGVDSLVGEREENKILKLVKIYSTTSKQEKLLNDNFVSFFDKDNYASVLTLKNGNGEFVFNDNKYFACFSTQNGGLPYLVYNEPDGFKKLMTVVATSINARFVVKNAVENSNNEYVYGNAENIIVVKDDELNKAVIYFNKNLQFNVEDILNITTTPYDANKNFEFRSLNNNVLSIVNGKLIINSVGNATVEISSKYNTNVKTYAYISVVDKIETFEVENKIIIANGKTKEVNAKILPKTANNGLYFVVTSDLADKILINNKQVQENIVYHLDSRTVITALDTCKGIIKVYPLTMVKFGEQDYVFIDFVNKKEIDFSVINSAKSVVASVNSIIVPENEKLEFEVYVDCTESENDQQLKFDNIENLTKYFEIDASKIEIGSNSTKFVVSVKAKDLALSQDQPFTFIIHHVLSGEISDAFAKVDVVLKSSKLQSVEINHFSSSVTYYKDYDIINKETIPNFNIVKGNYGVLSINLYPSYANVTNIDVTSSVQNGHRINFSQLKLESENKLTVTSCKDTLWTGIKLNVDRDEIKENGGNLFVATLLTTDILDDTVFTITVICYNSLGQKYEPVSINLKAKALTTLMLTNPNGSDEFFAPRGGELKIDVNPINMDEDFKIGAENFEFTIEDRNLNQVTFNGNVTEKNGFNFLYDKETKSLFGYKIENGQLVVLSDLQNKRNTILKITPKYKSFVYGKETESVGASIEVKVVDFFVEGISVSDSTDNILKNSLGNSTILKADLLVNSCKEFKYLDSNSNEISGFSYEGGQVFFDNLSRELELSNINLSIESLTNSISKSNYSWNLITQNSSGNLIYNNIKENTTYTNFLVNKDDSGFYYVIGKNVSENRMIVKANLSYENGQVLLKQNSDYEISSEFMLDIKTQSSLDNPLPIYSANDFSQMLAGGDYILMNDITLDENFAGIDTEISSFDGNNKTINIQSFLISSTNQTNLGLFNEIKENTIIKNLKVNILPSLCYAENDYFYGLNINAQMLNSLNFGVICGVNKGVITNCKVVNNNFKIVNNANVFGELKIFVNVNENIEAFFGGLVGVNEGYITNCGVGLNSNDYSNSMIIESKAQMGGLVSVNSKKIAGSYVLNTAIYNNSLSKITGGFVSENQNGAVISTSYVQGYSEKPLEIHESLKDGGIFANGNVGGFVAINEGNVKDCYSNILISTNKRSSGFVYDNSNGYVETCISLSNSSSKTQSFRPFTGNDEENISLNNYGIKYCYYKSEESDLNGGEGEFDEPANGIMNFSDASYFEGFICDDTESSIWSFNKNLMPRLVDADKNIVCERELINSVSSQTEKYQYIYINNNIGTLNNPIVISTTEQFFDALTNENNLYSYYFNGKIKKTNINYNYISIVKDLDLSKIIDKNNNETNTTNEVQKLQDIIFAGNLNGNSMLLENITITAKNDKLKYSSFGLFKQIGVELTYDNSLKIGNEKLDKDNCSVIKNAYFEIDGISATITKTVGTLSGEVINSKLYNINIYNNNNVVVTGNNIVGGVAGRISGNSFVKGVSSNLSVKATFENKTSKYDYLVANSKKVYRYAYNSVEDNINENANIVGGIFGVVDIYQTQIKNFTQHSDGSSYYLDAEITRDNDYLFDNANIQFTQVSGNVQLTGDIVGGLFGYVLNGSKIYDAKFVLNESNTQNLIAGYAVGGVAGINKGLISYATVETQLLRQRVIDKTSQDGYLTSYLFSNANNKAYFIGGLVGVLQNGVLNYSYSKANITAKNSRFVGSSVGAFINSRIEYVYANSYLEAQDEVVQNGVILTQKGYAGFIGTITDFSNSSRISHAVSIIRNTENSNKFNLSKFVGYNQCKNIDSSKIDFEYSNDVEEIGVVGGNSYENNGVGYSYNKYITYDSGTFNGYSNSDCFVRIINKDTFFRLTYNKKGSVTEINNENDLRNMFSNGECVLTKDIYLTSPWEPISEFKGSFYSAKRENRQEGQSEYYKIYNLTINEKSKNVANNVGFFASTSGATISNITFVVGSNFVDPGDGQDPTETDPNWGSDNSKDKIRRGINIINTNVERNYALGILSAQDNGSKITNITLEFSEINDSTDTNVILTNLNYIGGLIGKAVDTNIDGVTIKNLSLKRTTTKNFDAYVGGLIGYVKNTNSEDIKNISFVGNNNVYNLQGKENERSYVGGLFGQIINSKIDGFNVLKEDSKLSVTHNANGVSGARSNVHVGGVAGNIQNVALSKIILNETSVEFTNTYNNLNSVYAGVVAGYAQEANYEDIIVPTSSSVVVLDNSQTSTSSNFVGGLFGQSVGGTLKNVLCSAEVSLEAISSNGQTNVGGLIGKNGNKNNDKFIKGTTLNNVICRSTIIVKDKGKSDCCIGGLIGYNIEAEVQDSVFLGSVKYFVQKLENIGGLVGANKNRYKNENGFDLDGKDNNNKNFNGCFFVEDLALLPARNVEYAEYSIDNKGIISCVGVVKYADFVDESNKILTNRDNDKISCLDKVRNILNNISSIKNFEDISEINGETITFKEGSVFNPYIISSEENLKDYKEDKYHLIKKDDLQISTTINKVDENGITSDFNAIIIGNGHKITLNSTSFAQKIAKNGVISGVQFELAGTDKTTFNGNEFVNNVSFIVANENSGVIYNCAIKGNMYVDNKSVAPVVIKNAGIINVISSMSHIVVKGLTIDNTYASGFVIKNSGAIYNSITTGNIEFIDNNYNIASVNTETSKIFGFVQENSDTIVNCISAQTLPLTSDLGSNSQPHASFGGVNATGKFANCYVDMLANGYFSGRNIPNGQSYVDFNSLFNKENGYIRKGSLSNLWSENDAQVMYGYAYPCISSYKNTFATLFNTKTNEGYYKVNNLSAFNFVIDSLNNNDEVTSINIKQIASFMGGVSKITLSGTTDAYVQKPIELKKSLKYDGKNFAINLLHLSSNLIESEGIKNSYTGLFYTLSENVNITINNVALLNAKFDIVFAENKKNNELSNVANNIYAGAFVALNKNGITKISNCYVEGTMKTIQASSPNFSTAKDMVVGGFVGLSGDKEGNEILSCVSKLNINLDYLIATKSFNKGTANEIGYASFVGGFVGKLGKGTITNNFNFADVTCASSKTASVGGIVGAINAGAITKNIMFGVVSYKGAYLSYYNKDNKLNYNINAIAGDIGAGCTTEDSGIKNQYNNLLNLVGDSTITETSLTDLMGYVDANLNNVNNFAVENSETKVFEKPKYEVENSNNLTLESNKNYIVNHSGEINISLKDDNSEKNLTNTKVLFASECTVTVTENLFNKLENCVISNLKIVSEQNLTTVSLAKEIVNTKLYKITVSNIYFDRNGNDVKNDNNLGNIVAVGGVVDTARSSILKTVKVENGRVKFDAQNAGNTNADYACVGGVAGYAISTLFEDCQNTATITTEHSTQNYSTLKTAGILGLSQNGYLFKCVNSGLVYAKNGNTTATTQNYVAGIVNAFNSSNVISFCKNENTVKGVNNKVSDDEGGNCVGGISTNGTVLFSINKSKVMSIAASNNENIQSAGIMASEDKSGSVMYSYQLGSVMSQKNAYAITAVQANYCYSIGGGFTVNGTLNLNGNKTNNCYTYKDIIENKVDDQGKYWFNNFNNISDFVVDVVDENKKIELPRIRLLDETVFKLTETGGVYQISNAFELWYWSVYKSADGISVSIVDDIDMTGYTYFTPICGTNITIDGNFHTISNLEIVETTEINTENKYWGFVGKNAGTIQNINFENPRITINNVSQQSSTTSDGSTTSENTIFGDNNYISIVAGQNLGKIDNVTVGQVGDTSSFININFITSDLKRQYTKIYIGTVSGQSNGTVSNCNVINLSFQAIDSSITQTANSGFMFSFEGLNIENYVGGIVGCNDNTISNCNFISKIKSHLTNMHTFGMGTTVSAGETNVDIDLYRICSDAKQYVGQIVGKGSSTGCYSPKTINLIDMFTKNNYGEEKYSSESSSYTVPIMDFDMSKFGAVLASGAIKGAKSFGLGAIVEITKQATVSAINKGTIESVFNNSGLGESAPNSFVKILNEDGNKDDNYIYISPYVSGFENSSTYIALTNDTDRDNFGRLPYNKNFLSLSQSKKAPKSENGNYYIYDINELAYALSEYSNQTLVLMDNIDMTRKVWNDELSLKKNAIIDNAFKIVYGSNTGFKDKFKRLFGEDFAINILIDKTSKANEYGKFETLIKNPTEIAYANFIERFKKVWKAEYSKTNNVTPAGLDLKFNELGNNETTFVVQYPSQLEVIADAMAEYTACGRLHKGINFTGKTIIIDNNVELTENLLSLDKYNYGESKKAPSFVTVGMVGDDTTIKYGENIENIYQAFNGTIKVRDNKNYSIKLFNNKQCLLQVLGHSGKIENLTLDAQAITDIYVDSNSNTSSLGVVENYGKIINFNVVSAETLTISRKINFIDHFVGVGTDEKGSKLYSSACLIFGLYCGYNAGTIQNCNFTNRNLTIKIETTVVYFDENIITINNNGTNTKVNIDTHETYSGYNRITTATNYVGVVSGLNINNICDIKINSVTLTINSTAENENLKDGKTSEIECGLGAGFVSGINNFIKDYTTSYTDSETKEKKNINLSNILVFESEIHANDLSCVSAGLISGVSELGFSSCKVLDSNITTNIADNENVTTGALSGRLMPKVYKTTEKYESVEVYTSYLPEVESCVSNNINLFGRINSITISEYSNKHDGKTYSSSFSFMYYDYVTNNESNNSPFGYCAYYCSFDKDGNLIKCENKEGSYTINLPENIKDSLQTVTSKAYYEHHVIDGENNDIVIPKVDKIEPNELANLRMKLTLKEDTEICFTLVDGSEIYKTNDVNYVKLNNLFEINLVKEIKDENGKIIDYREVETSTCYEDQIISINGQKFVGTITFGDAKENISSEEDLILGFKFKVTYSNLSFNSNMVVGNTLGQISLPIGFSFVESLDTVVESNGIYHVNYEFTVDGTKYEFKNITLKNTTNG